MVVLIVMQVTMPNAQHLPSLADDARGGVAKALGIETDDVYILSARPAPYQPSEAQIKAWRGR